MFRVHESFSHAQRLLIKRGDVTHAIVSVIIPCYILTTIKHQLRLKIFKIPAQDLIPFSLSTKQVCFHVQHLPAPRSYSVRPSFSRLGLPKRRFKSNIVGLARSPVAHAHGVNFCRIFPSVDLVILQQITSVMPSTRLLASVRSKCKHLCLADNNFDIQSRVDVLFGADILPSLVRPHAVIEHHSGLPSALDTQC